MTGHLAAGHGRRDGAAALDHVLHLAESTAQVHQARIATSPAVGNALVTALHRHSSGSGELHPQSHQANARTEARPVQHLHRGRLSAPRRRPRLRPPAGTVWTLPWRG